MIAENLTWKPHINMITSKISKNVGMMYKVGQFLTKEVTKTLLYPSLYTHTSITVTLYGPTIIL